MYTIFFGPKTAVCRPEGRGPEMNVSVAVAGTGYLRKGRVSKRVWGSFLGGGGKNGWGDFK